MNSHLKDWMRDTKARDSRIDGVQDGINGSVKGAAKASSQQWLCDGGKNADGGIHPDLLKDWLNGIDEGVVEDLC